MATKSRTLTVTVHLRKPHKKQRAIKQSKAKRKIVRAGRRGGKTTLAADETVDRFLKGQRVLYAVPTGDQLTKWWFEVTHALEEPIREGVYYINNSEHTITRPGTENRIRGKTAWNADTLRGDFADFLILDEAQLMNEDTWGLVGAPMLLDNDGDAMFIYTPPSLKSRSVSKATDKMWMTKFAKVHANDPTGRWEIFTFTSHENPYISKVALADLVKDMSYEAIQQEIYVNEDIENPRALWTRKVIEQFRVTQLPRAPFQHNKKILLPVDLSRIVVAVDPTGSATGDECGIVVGGVWGGEDYVLEDLSLNGTPEQWSRAVVGAFHKYKADLIVAEDNYGGEMVEHTIKTADPSVTVKRIHASRGKVIRAEPISVRYTQGIVHHVGGFGALEDEMCLWSPGDASPNRLDALVWLITELEGLSTNDDLDGLGHIEEFKSRWVETYGEQD